jgi:hypothetical protein
MQSLMGLDHPAAQRQFQSLLDVVVGQRLAFSVDTSSWN